MSNSTSKIFKDAGIFKVSPGTNQRVKLRIANKQLNMFLLTGLEGSQPYRTQIDVALDQTSYVLGAGKGLGSETFGLIDGPFECKEAVDTALGTLKTIKNTTDRKITITVAYGSGTMEFTGLLSRFNFKLDDTQLDGSYYIITAVEAVGTWK